MKKLLTILGSLGLVAMTGATVVACGLTAFPSAKDATIEIKNADGVAPANGLAILELPEVKAWFADKNINKSEYVIPTKEEDVKIDEDKKSATIKVAETSKGEAGTITVKFSKEMVSTVEKRLTGFFTSNLDNMIFYNSKDGKRDANKPDLNKFSTTATVFTNKEQFKEIKGNLTDDAFKTSYEAFLTKVRNAFFEGNTAMTELYTTHQNRGEDKGILAISMKEYDKNQTPESGWVEGPNQDLQFGFRLYMITDTKLEKKSKLNEILEVQTYKINILKAFNKAIA